MKRMMLRTTLSFRLNQMKKVHLIETPIHSNNSEMDQLVVDLWAVALVLEDHLIETIILSNSLEHLQLMVQLWLTRPQGNHHLRLLRPQRPLRLDLRQLLQVISNQQRASMFWLTASRLLSVLMRVKAALVSAQFILVKRLIASVPCMTILLLSSILVRVQEDIWLAILLPLIKPVVSQLVDTSAIV